MKSAPESVYSAKAEHPIRERGQRLCTAEVGGAVVYWYSQTWFIRETSSFTSCVLHSTNIQGHIKTGIDLWQCALMMALLTWVLHPTNIQGHIKTGTDTCDSVHSWWLCLFGFYILPTSKVILKQVPTVVTVCTHGDFAYLGFRSYQHPRSYQDRHRLVTVCTHGEYSAAPLWDEAAGTMPQFFT